MNKNRIKRVATKENSNSQENERATKDTKNQDFRKKARELQKELGDENFIEFVSFLKEFLNLTKGLIK